MGTPEDTKKGHFVVNGWPGRGRLYIAADGAKRWIIRKEVRGDLFTITTRAERLEDAEVEFALFKRDPVAYRKIHEARVVVRGDSIRLDIDSVNKLTKFMAGRRRSPRHIKDTESYLLQWIETLGIREFKSIDLSEFLQVLKGGTARRNRIAALKTFSAWARETGELKVNEDPTTELKFPAKRAEKNTREKGYAAETIEKLYAGITQEFADLPLTEKSGRRTTEERNETRQAIRDQVLIQAKTGMHSSEVSRVAKGEGCVLKVLKNQPEIAATLRFDHKVGVHIISIDPQTLAAVRRLQARGKIVSDSYTSRVLDRVTKELKLGDVRLGEFRHSLVTWLRATGQKVKPVGMKGLALEEIAQLTNHKSAKTTKDFYDGTTIPEMLVHGLVFKNKEDPSEQT